MPVFIKSFWNRETPLVDRFRFSYIIDLWLKWRDIDNRRGKVLDPFWGREKQVSKSEQSEKRCFFFCSVQNREAVLPERLWRFRAISFRFNLEFDPSSG